MALVKQADVAAQQTVTSLPPNVPLPRDRFSGRVTKADFGNSKSSGNPMITLEVEIYHPAEVKARNGQTYSVAGLGAKTYLSMQPQALSRVFEVMHKLGLPMEIDTENPDTEQFVGKTFSGIWGAEERAQRKELTEEDKLAGKKQGEIITDESGQPIISYGVRLIDIIGPTSAKAPEKPF